jgi:hypothetical protein
MAPKALFCGLVRNNAEDESRASAAPNPTTILAPSHGDDSWLYAEKRLLIRSCQES